MSTVTATVTIEDPIGFHARPAGQIVKLVKESGLEIRMGKSRRQLGQGQLPSRADGHERQDGRRANCRG
jgi:phosphocarrier protein HPr